MRFSRFNQVFSHNADYYLYNSLSNSLWTITERFYNAILDNTIDYSDENIINNKSLISSKILSNDSEELKKIIDIYNNKSFSSEEVYLTIAPTMDCNFACNYCFEKNKVKDYMSTEIEDAIISFIKNKMKLKKLTVCWFGGEPTLAINQILSLTEKFKNLNLDTFKSNMITNGFELDKLLPYCEVINLESLQITLDGIGETHNKQRPHKKNKNSFEKIIDNLDSLVKSIELGKINPIHINIRVNINTDNYKEYKNVYDYIIKRYNYKNIFVYPGFIYHTPNNQKISSCFTKEKTKLFLLKESNIDVISKMLYPSNLFYYCSACSKYSFVVDPKGYFYKCWEDIGNLNESIGNILNDEIIESYKNTDYINQSNKYKNNECLNCNILPICNTCPKEYINNTELRCSVFKNNPELLLYSSK